MAFGDIKVNGMVGEDGLCRCHGLMSPTRTPSGDTARVTREVDCIMQRIVIWLAVKKGERPLHPHFGCCIRSYMHQPLTVAKLKELRGNVQAELEALFPEYVISNLRVEVPERNTVDIKANVGPYPVQFLGDPASLNELNSMLNAALKDLRMASY